MWYTMKCEGAGETNVLIPEEYTSNSPDTRHQTPVNIVTSRVVDPDCSFAPPPPRTRRAEPLKSLCRSLFILRKVVRYFTYKHFRPATTTHLCLHLTSLPPHIYTNMAADLQAIAGQLQASLDPQQSRQGESSPHIAPMHHLHQC